MSTPHDNTVSGAEGWIEWSGGECPVDRGEIVICQLRGQTRAQASAEYDPDHPEAFRACEWYWGHDGSGGDIIAYRVVQS